MLFQSIISRHHTLVLSKPRCLNFSSIEFQPNRFHDKINVSYQIWNLLQNRTKLGSSNQVVLREPQPFSMDLFTPLKLHYLLKRENIFIWLITVKIKGISSLSLSHLSSNKTTSRDGGIGFCPVSLPSGERVHRIPVNILTCLWMTYHVSFIFLNNDLFRCTGDKKHTQNILLKINQRPLCTQ